MAGYGKSHRTVAEAPKGLPLSFGINPARRRPFTTSPRMTTPRSCLHLRLHPDLGRGALQALRLYGYRDPNPARLGRLAI